MITLEAITNNVIRITVPETLKAEDFAQIVPQIDTMIRCYGQIRLLVDASHFNGWENLVAFEKHMGFVKSHQQRVNRIALIAGHDWQHWVVGIFKIFVHPSVRVFDLHESDKAMEWLTSHE